MYRLLTLLCSDCISLSNNCQEQQCQESCYIRRRMHYTACLQIEHIGQNPVVDCTYTACGISKKDVCSQFWLCCSDDGEILSDGDVNSPAPAAAKPSKLAVKPRNPAAIKAKAKLPAAPAAGQCYVLPHVCCLSCKGSLHAVTYLDVMLSPLNLL